MYYLAKSIDKSRLIEDNSLCCGGVHTATDINSWHVYLPGYAWEKYLKDKSEKISWDQPINIIKVLNRKTSPL